MLKFARAQIGKPFSSIGMARALVWPRKTNYKSWFCAELVAACLQAGGLMNETLKNNYFVDVGLNIVKGFIVLGGLSGIFGFFLLGALFLFFGPIDEYTKQQLEYWYTSPAQQDWCSCSRLKISMVRPVAKQLITKDTIIMLVVKY